MKVAFLHYHLKTGGVTTVINQQINAIKNTCEVVLVAGEPACRDLGYAVVHVPGIGYNSRRESLRQAEAVADRIIAGIKAHWPKGCDVLHVHNPTLAKNVNFLKVLKILQQRGVVLFLQIHDFAEDGRSSAFFFDEDYLENCHYGVINSRDYDILQDAGLKEAGLHLIANNVHFMNLGEAQENFQFCPKSRKKDFAKHKIEREIILYPIRAIRRKNVGEAILLSLFHHCRETLAITLPPNSKADWDSYAGWQKFVAQMNLDVIFEASREYAFDVLYQAARYIITTSINEGFGFCFLEPWTAQKALYGRLIPDICADFIKKGVVLDHLYPTLRVSLDWFDQDAFCKDWKACVRYNFNLFKQNISPSIIDQGFAKMVSEEWIDFGLLDEFYQKQVIFAIKESDDNRQRFLALNPYLTEGFGQLFKSEMIENNDKVVRRNYCEALYARKLLEIYDKVVGTNVVQKIDKTKVVARFFNLDYFSLLKWGAYRDA